MRDIIWTIIVIWVVWRLIDAFRSISTTRKTQGASGFNQNNTNDYSQQSASTPPKKGGLKSDAGEYVDYEEVK